MIDQSQQTIQGGRLICRKCVYIKSPGELIDYGRYRICRDCARKFELMKTDRRVDAIEDFVIAEQSGTG